jgi:hypothetical protein
MERRIVSDVLWMMATEARGVETSENINDDVRTTTVAE